MRCDRDAALAIRDDVLAAMERHAKLAFHGLGAIVHRVKAQAIQPFVDREERDGRADAFHRVIRRLRNAACVDDAPARAVPQIAQEPDDRARAISARAPLAERGAHALGDGDAPELEVSREIRVANLRRIHAEDAFHVVIAHVVEVPRRASIARDARLPARMERRRFAVAHERFDGLVARHVREREALRREAHARAPRVLERPQVRTDTVIVRHAVIDLEWKRPA